MGNTCHFAGHPEYQEIDGEKVDHTEGVRLCLFKAFWFSGKKCRSQDRYDYLCAACAKRTSAYFLPEQEQHVKS